MVGSKIVVEAIYDDSFPRYLSAYLSQVRLIVALLNLDSLPYQNHSKLPIKRLRTSLSGS